MPRTPPADRRTIFVATTEETMKSSWFTRALTMAAKAVDMKYADIELTPWPSSFEEGDLTAPKLIDVACMALGAVVIFAGDDTVTSRGLTTRAPRDNLVLEAGMFLSRLGLRGVLLLREENSKWPSDLLGVTAKEFTPPSPERSGAIEIVSKDVAESITHFIDRFPHRDKTSAGAALDKTATKMIRGAETFNKKLESPAIEEPITIYDPREAYVDALSHVETAFATTTYLDSGFWTSRDIKIVGANQRMLKKIKGAKGTARRLILLSRPTFDELDSQRHQRRLLRSGAPQEVERMDREYREFARTNLELTNQGFVVKVVHDCHAAYQHLPENMFHLGDTELALYDNARVDSFSGFTSKERSRVDVYDASKFLEFEVLQQHAAEYFAALWDSPEAEDFADFDVRMNDMMEDVAGEIDYSPNWLALYDRAIGEDGKLKTAETELVREWLSKRHGSIKGLLASHIDLGTCTGRYVAELDDCLRTDASVMAIDIDPDCVKLVRLKQSHRELRQDAVVCEGDIRRRDKLPSRTYDLVTCMMGTLCHLSRKTHEKGVYHDDWQTALENIARLLTGDGDAFVAVWYREAGKNNHVALDIYDERSRSMLYKQSPPTAELQARVKQAGLEILGEDLVLSRLRVMHLTATK
jgi:SAM-dependent methyltransferase